MGKRTFSIDWLMTALLVCLGVLGLFLMLTIDKALFTSQLAYCVVGFMLLFAIARIDWVFLYWVAPYGYILSCVFLLLSYLGPAIRGATRWIVIGGIQLQPSELVKPLLLLAFAYFMTRYSPRKLANTGIHIILFLIPFFLVFRQPDLGTSIVYAISWLTMLIASGVSLLFLAGIMLFVAIVFPVLWNVLAPYQKDRIYTFINPHMDPKGAGYNALQSMIAVGSGKLFGRGLGRGTQSQLRFLPEHHTDFIFATLVEDLGFVGGFLMLLWYAFILWRMIAPFLKGIGEHVFFYSYSIGLFGMILGQVFINVGMNMGLLPITGITLPFVSYGGSSILSLCIAFGIYFALKKHYIEKENIAIETIA